MLSKPADVLEMLAPPVPLEIVSVPLPTLVAAVCEIAPAPLAVNVVTPVMFVLPMLMLPLVPALVVRLSVPPVIVPVVASVPPEAESTTVNVPLPTFEVCTVVEAVSVTAVVPEVAVASRKLAFVLETVAPPVPLLSASVPVKTFVPPA
jgi:hypothetical protein